MSPPAAEPSGRTGRPPRTSRAQIMAAAGRLIDRDGWQKLTMRRLAAEAGTSPTTLYHHIRDKEDLLTRLLDDHADSTPRPDLPRDPRERIAAAATAIHDSLATWPWIVEILTADDLTGDSALWMVETIVAGAVDCGCTPEQAVHVYRGIWYYTVGEIVVRTNAARRRAESERPAHRDTRFRSLDPAELPHLAALGERWPELTARDTYASGLRALIDGLLPHHP
ncbi:TetR/AcrR family transcriptional regulator [Streptomyces sp. SID3343]|uniref:TetR/AcrR family transcriptional regulator n=1 Tax=Streptomyces sp. SID3343 TaxID=2690260 RepID=UPI00136EABF8|nr:TetR/AcrR family transcriptional regulator [Streptomyces sp. SID3343]MYV97696.1 TetR family transcriptional regulator [Streptomyces sp. SID3343]